LNSLRKMSELSYEKYNKKSFALRPNDGNRNKYQSIVKKQLNGRWNPKMKNGTGWLVSLENEKGIKILIESLKAEQVFDDIASKTKSRKGQNKYHRAVSEDEAEDTSDDENDDGKGGNSDDENDDGKEDNTDDRKEDNTDEYNKLKELEEEEVKKDLRKRRFEEEEVKEDLRKRRFEEEEVKKDLIRRRFEEEEEVKEDLRKIEAKRRFEEEKCLYEIEQKKKKNDRKAKKEKIKERIKKIESEKQVRKQTRTMSFYKDFTKTPSEFKNIHDTREYIPSSSDSDSDSVSSDDDFPSPSTPKRRHSTYKSYQTGSEDYDELKEKMKDIQRRLYDLELSNRKYKLGKR
jgi:hypothetical protein